MVFRRLRSARLAGLKVFYGQILSEFAEESVELGHVMTVLAATDNDAYNALVCTALAPDIGRDRIFQLSMGPGEDDDPRGVSLGLRGKVAFREDAEYENLWRLHVDGWTFSRTRLTESYTYSDFLGDVDSRSLQILRLRQDARAQFLSPQTEVEPEAGDVLVCFGPPRPADAPVKPPARGRAEGSSG